MHSKHPCSNSQRFKLETLWVKKLNPFSLQSTRDSFCVSLSDETSQEPVCHKHAHIKFPPSTASLDSHSLVQMNQKGLVNKQFASWLWRFNWKERKREKCKSCSMKTYTQYLPHWQVFWFRSKPAGHVLVHLRSVKIEMYCSRHKLASNKPDRKW